jgi:hypothetical protein
MLLLKVQAGSRLYGYATDSSDDDYLEVHTQPFMIDTREAPRQVKQTIVDGIDTIQMTLSAFAERAASGSHQALDAMFAAEPLVDEIQGFRENFHVGYEVVPTYVRIITKFAVQEGYRKQRHALRAMFNLEDMLKTGRYNPELSQDRIDFILEKAHLPYSEFRELLLQKSPVSLEDHLPNK